jgi:hypothetical protein
MTTGEITVGMHVRYPRTGTTGKVTRIDEIGGHQYAEVDTTHLFYRIDSLIPAEGKEKQKIRHEMHRREDDLKRMEKERAAPADDVERAIDDVTGVGAG